MPENTGTEAPSVAMLVSGIVADAQKIVALEAALAKRELQRELVKVRSAATIHSFGLAAGVIGGIFLCHMLAHLLSYASGERWHLWACYGIVGGVFAVAAGILLYIARNRFREIDLVPWQTIESMKEHVQWIKNKN